VLMGIGLLWRRIHFLPCRTSLPALSGDEVADVAPVDAVLAALALAVVDRALAVGPVAVEEAVVGALAGRGGALLEHFGGSYADWGGVGGDRRRQGDEERSEGDHVCTGMD
jgi:hypothetical protein